MTIPIPEEDQKKLDEIDKWAVWDADGNRVFRKDTPPEVIAEQRRLAKKYFPFD